MYLSWDFLIVGLVCYSLIQKTHDLKNLYKLFITGQILTRDG
jgi:hypothetical protein